MNQIKIAHITTVDVSLSHLLLHQMQSIQHPSNGIPGGCEVVGISMAGRDVPVIKAAGIRHIAVAMTRNFTPLADLASLWQLYRVMRRERFSIVHTHTPKAGLLGQLAARLAGVPIVINTLHGFYFHDHMSRAWRRFYITTEKIAACCSHLILSQNEEDIRTAIREKICRPGKIKHLGNGIDLREFNPSRVSPDEELRLREQLGISPRAPVVGFVGRLAARRKGFLDFMAAAKKVAEELPQVRFLIVGDTDHGKPDAVEPSVAADYGIADRCHFIGRRPNAELPPLYKLMTLLVLPSLFEGVPRVVMEASAMGIPSVVTDVKGNREAVEHERNGLLVPLGDVPALSAAILRILTEIKTARRMGCEARAMALERFDEEKVFERVKADYRCLLDRKKKAVARQVRQDRSLR